MDELDKEFDMTNATTCSINGCGRKIVAKRLDLCGTHNLRRKRGLPMDVPIRAQTRTAEESFHVHTEWQGECLVWTGAIHENGYGIIWDRKRVVRAHRWAYEQGHGAIRNGKDIDHICGNRLCCNVKHLRVTSRKQNMENLTTLNVNNRSGVRGVGRTKDGKRWRVRVKHNYREYFGGEYDRLEDAESAAIALRNKLFTHNDRDRAA